MSIEEMTMTQQREHLAGGGTFEAAGGALRVRYLADDDLYLIVNRTGSQSHFIQERLATVLDLAEQLTPLSEWRVVDGG